MDRVAFLGSTELFARVPRELIERVAGKMEECSARSGEVIFREGEFGDAVYLIVDGSLELRADDHTLLSRKGGECVGEFALMDNAPRSASAVAESDVTLLKWRGEDFDRALREDETHALSGAVLRMLTRKLREDVGRQSAPADRGGGRFDRVNSLFQAALECDSGERGKLLESLSGSDPDLAAEVRALLESHKEMGDFLEWYLDDRVVEESTEERETDPAVSFSEPELKPGQRLGVYEITECLAVGGMAHVYAAKDTILGRDVALKLLPPHLAASPTRRRRLEREARIVAKLNDPRIVTLYSAEQVSGVYFITMELVDGETLSERIPPGGMKLDEFFRYASAVAGAVAIAHDNDVTHRDLKPDNIMVSVAGAVKVLDFGLAKARLPLQTEFGRKDFSTEQGRIIGTIPYMSPEQAEGKKVDERTDVFSIGVVFYKMLTGEAPFVGDSPTSVLSSILRDTPTSPSEVNPDVPVALSRLVERCLEKEADRRYPNGGAVAKALDHLRPPAEPSDSAPS